MNRRHFLHTAGLVSAGLAFPEAATLLARDSANAAADLSWRTFEVITRVEVLKPAGVTRIWIPAALTTETPFQKTLSNTFNAEAGSAKLIENKPDSLGIISAEFPEGAKAVITSTSRISTRNYAVDFFAPGKAGNANAPKEKSAADLDYFLRPQKSSLNRRHRESQSRRDYREKSRSADTPTLVKSARHLRNGLWSTLPAILKRAAAALTTSGSGDASKPWRPQPGKCADLNALYVGLAPCRPDLPAREMLLNRVAPSELGLR